MRYLIAVVLLISLDSHGQILTKNDSINIGFKAKLMTLSEFGIDKKENILNDIANQKAVFLTTTYADFLFIKIKFNQPYKNLSNGTTTLIRDCHYYVGFNKKSSRFYRLGGFDFIDIDYFIEDLEKVESKIFNIGPNISPEIEEIDINCMYEYYDMSPKKRLKKGYSCFTNCSAITSQYYKISKEKKI